MVVEFVKDLVRGTPFEPPARWCLKRLRYYSMPKQKKLNQAYDEQAIQVMSRVLNEDSNCIDVGCHAGVILMEILRFAPSGKHYAFEPIPQMAERLRKKFPNVNVYELALSDTTGSTTFNHVLDFPGWSGIRKRSYPKSDPNIECITVKLEKLDNLIPEDVKIDLIKVDVEGAEFQVFSGAVETLKRNKPFVVFEHGIGGADHYGTTPEMVYELLVDNCGLHISLMRDWLRGKEPLTRKSFIQQGTHGPNWYFLAHP
jgi:FkbM family methyltransferase